MNSRVALLSVLVLVFWNPLAADAAGVDDDDPKPDPTSVEVALKTPVPSAKEVRDAQARGVEILLGCQESLDGGEVPMEWPYEGVYRRNGEIPIGYRVGGTSISAWALLESPGWKQGDERHDAMLRALDFVLASLWEDDLAATFRGTYDVRGWGHGYALRFLLRLRELKAVPEEQQEAVDDAIVWLVEAIQLTEIPEHGGWSYARGGGLERLSPTSPFMTAPILQALFEAAKQGVEVDEEVIGRALDALERGRAEDGGAYGYSIPGRQLRREAMQGAIGRTPVAETTLMLAGRGDPERLRRAVESFFEHWTWLEKRRRQEGTHVPPYNVAPYYFFYAHGYVAQAIELLPEKERPAFREKLRSILWYVREESGGWNDRVFDRSENYGTAMSLLALAAPEMPAPARWEATK